MKNKSGKELVEIMKNNPAAADQCEWETLNADEETSIFNSDNFNTDFITTDWEEQKKFLRIE